MIQTAETETVITEEYAALVYRTGRGWMAEVDDARHALNGTYALGSTQACALAALKEKVREQQGH
jgi:hypothetical protein